VVADQVLADQVLADQVLVDQVLAVAICCLAGAYLLTTVSSEGAHEIAPIAPFAAALAGRVLGDRMAGAARRAGAHRRLAASGRRSLTAAVAVVAGAAVLAGYAAGLGYELTRPSAAPQYLKLASWLAAHHLTDGLAAYWVSSSVTVESAGAVTVRALQSDELAPYLWMADGRWYDPASHTADFLIEDDRPGYATGWTWDGIVGRFGNPVREYRTGQFTVLVWHENLLGRLAGGQQ
jgi:hypothetical protein